MALHGDFGGRDVGLPFGQTRPLRSGIPDVRETVYARPRNGPGHATCPSPHNGFRMQDEWIVRSSLKAGEDARGESDLQLPPPLIARCAASSPAAGRPLTC